MCIPKIRHLSVNFIRLISEIWAISLYFADFRGGVRPLRPLWIRHWTFPLLCPDLKGPPGHLVIGCSVCSFVCLSVISSLLHVKCNIWSSGGDAIITKLGLLVRLMVVHTLQTSHAPGCGVKCSTYKVCHILTLLLPSASVFHKHILFPMLCRIPLNSYIWRLTLMLYRNSITERSFW